jgi:2-oxoisovalerate dehydrogenase E1 component
MLSTQSHSTSEADLLSVLTQKAMLIRSVEQRLLKLFSEGKLFGTVHTCIGQEWTGVAVAQALRDGDTILSNHRGHGHFLARTGDVDGLIAEVMGKQNGVCGGRGGSQHICARGFYSNGIQGGMTPIAAGLALARKLRGESAVTAVFIGDGTLGEGVLYESLNIASKWDLPVLFVVENNLYAQSTSQTQTMAGGILERAAAFGIRSAKADTWQFENLITVASDTVAEMRSSGRPALLRIDTYRLMAHSKGDDDRDTEEVKAYWAKDPLVRFAGQRPRQAEQYQLEIDQRVDAAVVRAEAAPYTAEASPREHAQPAPHWSPTCIDAADRMSTLIHAGLQRNMQRDERIVLIGEDIEGPYGGAFKVTKNLSLEFPGRVRNTPISEAAIVGLGNGLALSGLRPVCEIMFGDFLTLAADQFINHAAKFRYMFNDQVTVPVIIRTPMGGKRGYGATHSQSIEKHFLGVPGTRVLALHSRFDPGRVYDQLFATIDRPTLVIENKALYALRVSDQAPEGFALEHSNDDFPTTRLRPAAKPDITILCYGGMLPDVEKAMDQLFDLHDVVAEVICPLQLYPLNPYPIIESTHRSGRLLIVEEGQPFAAFGAEVIAQIAESDGVALPRIRRIAAPAHPIPSCGPLEKAILPGVTHVVEAALELMGL